MKIDHIGVVVKDICKGIAHWKDCFGYHQATEIIHNSQQQVHVAFLEKVDSITIKLVQPSDTQSPVYAFAMRGGGLHHLCFYCSDMPKQTQELARQGFRILAGPQPGEAFENNDITFLYAQGLNIELVDTLLRAGRL